MYITPAIQDFQPIHPAVYLRAADPAGPVCVVDKLPIHIYSYRSPPGLFFYLKTKGGRAADPGLFQFTDTGIVEFQECFKGIVTSCDIRVFVPGGVHKEEGTVQVPLYGMPAYFLPSGGKGNFGISPGHMVKLAGPVLPCIHQVQFLPDIGKFPVCSQWAADCAVG